MKKTLYIAYGSNLNKAQMAFRCPNAKPVGTAELEGYKLVFQGRRDNAHANVIPAEGNSVPVAIWEVDQRDERALDRYEGVSGGYYTKEYIELEGRKALIYIMTPHNYGIPTAHYANVIAEGYKDFGFDDAVLLDAIQDAIGNTIRVKEGA